MEEETGTITIKKSSIWKYSTFVLGALVIVLAFLYFSDKGSPTGNVVNTGQEANANTGPSAQVSLDAFLSDSNLYPSLGPKNAEKTVIEFSDFQCPFCAMASGLPSWTSNYASQYGDLIGSAGKIQEMAEKGEVRFIYVPMSFLGQESVYAAQASLCANQQGKFWEMHDAIFAAHDSKENNGKYSKDNLKKLAQKITGLDQKKFADCLDNDKTLSDVQKVSNEASKAASGTPTFFVNGKQLSGSWQQLSAALNSA